jgi:cytochrome c-type biogenesis protein
MGEVLFGTALLASFLGGVVALFAPCCVSVMLPAYLATGARRRSGVLVATVVFAAGIATVIVPIGLGASALSALAAGHHFAVYAAGGVTMAIGGVAVLAGWRPRLPMIVGWTPGGHGWAATYGLGVFSGLASSCCAPVLAGIAILSGATASFPTALAVSMTYVTGMAAPLFVLAMIWDSREGAASRFLHARSVTLRAGRLRRTLPLGMLLSGLLLIGIGVLTIGVAFAGPGMGSGGWQGRLNAWLQHQASVITHDLAWLPGWVFALLLVAGAAMIGWRIRHSSRPPVGADTRTVEATPPPPPAHRGPRSPTILDRHRSTTDSNASERFDTMTRSNSPGPNAAQAQSKTRQRKAKARAAQAAAIHARRRALATRWAAGLIVAAVATAGLYAVFRHSNTSNEDGAGPAYQVGSPGPGPAGTRLQVAFEYRWHCEPLRPARQNGALVLPGRSGLPTLLGPDHSPGVRRGSGEGGRHRRGDIAHHRPG